MRRFFGLLVVLTFALCSCINQDDVSIKGVENVSLRSLSNVDMTLGVENLSGKNINIESAKFRIDNQGDAVITMLLKDKVVIPKRSTSSVTMNWAVKFDNPLGALSVVSTLKRSQANLTVSGEVVVKGGWVRKKIELKAVPLSQILSNFGVKTEDIIKSL